MAPDLKSLACDRERACRRADAALTSSLDILTAERAVRTPPPPAPSQDHPLLFFLLGLTTGVLLAAGPVLTQYAGRLLQ